MLQGGALQLQLQFRRVVANEVTLRPTSVWGRMVGNLIEEAKDFDSRRVNQGARK